MTTNSLQYINRMIYFVDPPQEAFLNIFRSARYNQWMYGLRLKMIQVAKKAVMELETRHRTHRCPWHIEIPHLQISTGVLQDPAHHMLYHNLDPLTLPLGLDVFILILLLARVPRHPAVPTPAPFLSPFKFLVRVVPDPHLIDIFLSKGDPLQVYRGFLQLRVLLLQIQHLGLPVAQGTPWTDEDPVSESSRVPIIWP
jgi:hypothetical protein